MHLASQDQSARYRYTSTAAARDTDTDAFVELQVVCLCDCISQWNAGDDVRKFMFMPQILCRFHGVSTPQPLFLPAVTDTDRVGF